VPTRTRNYNDVGSFIGTLNGHRAHQVLDAIDKNSFVFRRLSQTEPPAAIFEKVCMLENDDKRARPFFLLCT